jgi:hypothetical protein
MKVEEEKVWMRGMKPGPRELLNSGHSFSLPVVSSQTTFPHILTFLKQHALSF